MILDKLESIMSPSERVFLDPVVSNLQDTEALAVYADWLEENGDLRGAILRQFIKGRETMNSSDFPNAKDVNSPATIAVWADLVGIHLLKTAADEDLIEFKPIALSLARPALRFEAEQTADESIPVGASKMGGLPDLPSPDDWPKGTQCLASYNDDTLEYEDHAGFLAQLDLEELAGTYAGKKLPSRGVLSFFCYHSVENIDAITVKAIHFPDKSVLSRTEPPGELAESNETIESSTINFTETLDLPESYDGPWSELLSPQEDSDRYDPILMPIRERNFENVLGYGRATTGADPTADETMQHLIVLSNAYECRLHIQIPLTELQAENFDAIQLAWVDFD